MPHSEAMAETNSFIEEFSKEEHGEWLWEVQNQTEAKVSFSTATEV